MSLTPFTISFKNEHTIYEKIVKCTIKTQELNSSYNPSLTPGGNVPQFATSSSFSPYVTAIGLYDNANNLLAIGKFGQPLPLSDKTDFNILLKFDV